MKRIVMTTLCFLPLAGCVGAYPPQQPYLNPATPIVSQPIVMRTQPSQADFRLAYGNNAALARAYQTYLNTGRAPNIITDGFIQFAYNAGQQPIINAAPLAITVISLEPGEKITNITGSDNNRWNYSLAQSGSGPTMQYQVMIKPSFPNISANFIITTDKRMYDIKAVSNGIDGKYDKDVRFWYPDDINDFWRNYNAEQQNQQGQSSNIADITHVDLSQLNFNYRKKSNLMFNRMPSWAPVNIFDDGTHTYMQFPANISNQDMPALFIVNGSQQELVNYRSKPPYFVVDKIFQKAILVMGVGCNQTSVTITNGSYC